MGLPETEAEPEQRSDDRECDAGACVALHAIASSGSRIMVCGNAPWRPPWRLHASLTRYPSLTEDGGCPVEPQRPEDEQDPQGVLTA